ncbi:hypothetical protein L7H23_17820 [Sphingopyxis sp. BSN-002]|uniref:hypothetical protein n=1 Tax=Sphingopyxis sp. BSN-002 TaxID=2911495 RepID=UPI001ED9F9A4|nr:hypothetical protein [Sphingopyxis sp. BSN-002]UKK84405.1 hypothetical protein L7H23_17820 [Sphingopyxis sp. BSN-002]
MTDAVKTPWHLWVIGGLSLLWNAFPVVDFTLTNMHNEGWLSQYNEAQRALILGAPAWSNICWAIGGFGSFVGSLLLLFRSRHSITAFLISAAGLAGTTWYQLVQNGDAFKKALGDVPLYVSITIWVILLALLFYARAMKARGVLR